jgi:hypothetical protein
MLDDGKELGMPDGVLMNGKGPYRYNDSLVPDGIEHETIKVEPGDYFSHSKHHRAVTSNWDGMFLNWSLEAHLSLVFKSQKFICLLLLHMNVTTELHTMFSLDVGGMMVIIQYHFHDGNTY